MQSIYQYPTVVIFAEGKGIATAKALIEAANDANGLDLNFRQEARLYYRVRILVSFVGGNTCLILEYQDRGNLDSLLAQEYPEVVF